MNKLEEHELTKAVRELISELSGLPSGLRQGIADALWARIPSHVSESAYALSATSLIVPPQTGDWELITSIVTYVPSSQSGFIQFGNQDLIPVGPGTTNLGPSKWVLGPGDSRTLYIGTPGAVSSTPGFIWMHLAGERMPTRGQMAYG